MWFLLLLAYLSLGIFITLFDVLFFIMFFSSIQSWVSGAPYVPIPIEVARAALKLAEVGPNDILYDLGSGDGRVLRLAVKEFEVKKAVGYEVSLWPHLLARFKNLFLPKDQQLKIELHRQNFNEANLSPASIVYLYLFPKLINGLKQKLQFELTTNAKVITCRYATNGWTPIREARLENISIFLYQPRIKSE